jgi:hypothetical protein
MSASAGRRACQEYASQFKILSRLSVRRPAAHDARSDPDRAQPAECSRCRGTAACYFQIAAGPPAVLSKRSCLSSSKMRTGESCLIGLSFDAANPWPDGKHACVCDGERLGIGDTKANRNNSKNLNRISPHEKGNEKGGNHDDSEGQHGLRYRPPALRLFA